MCATFKDVVKNHEIILLSKWHKPGSQFIYRLETWSHKGKCASPFVSFDSFFPFNFFVTLVFVL